MVQDGTGVRIHENGRRRAKAEDVRVAGIPLPAWARQRQRFHERLRTHGHSRCAGNPFGRRRPLSVDSRSRPSRRRRIDEAENEEAQRHPGHEPTNHRFLPPAERWDRSTVRRITPAILVAFSLPNCTFMAVPSSAIARTRSAVPFVGSSACTCRPARAGPDATSVRNASQHRVGTALLQSRNYSGESDLVKRKRSRHLSGPLETTENACRFDRWVHDTQGHDAGRYSWIRRKMRGWMYRCTEDQAPVSGSDPSRRWRSLTRNWSISRPFQALRSGTNARSTWGESGRSRSSA